MIVIASHTQALSSIPNIQKKKRRERYTDTLTERTTDRGRWADRHPNQPRGKELRESPGYPMVTNWADYLPVSNPNHSEVNEGS